MDLSEGELFPRLLEANTHGGKFLWIDITHTTHLHKSFEPRCFCLHSSKVVCLTTNVDVILVSS
jgi:hypothetical protein